MRQLSSCATAADARQVRIGKLSGNDFVLLGLEDFSHRKVSAVYPHAWWCRVRPDASSQRHHSTRVTKPSFHLRETQPWKRA